MDAKKTEKFCRPIRIIVGLLLIAYAVYSGNKWFYLGIIPLIIGLVGFRPFCVATGQCSALGKEEKEN